MPTSIFQVDNSIIFFCFSLINSELEKDLPDATKSEQKVEPIQKVEPTVKKTEPVIQKQDPPPPINNSPAGFNSDLMNLIITENRLQNTGKPRKLWILLHSTLFLLCNNLSGLF